MKHEIIMENWRKYLKEDEEDPRTQAMRNIFRQASEHDPTKTKIRGVEVPTSQIYQDPAQKKQKEFINKINSIQPGQWASQGGKGELCKIFGSIVELTWKARLPMLIKAKKEKKNLPDIGIFLIKQSMPILKDLLKTITIELAYEYAPKVNTGSDIGRIVGKSASGKIKIPVAKAGYDTLKSKTKKVINIAAYQAMYKKVKFLILKKLLIMMIPFLNKAYLIYKLYRVSSCAKDAREGITKKYTAKLEQLMAYHSRRVMT